MNQFAICLPATVIEAPASHKPLLRQVWIFAPVGL